MPEKCGRCNKTVYPMEKMNCQAANKTWHKGCFRCVKCNCQLNLKTYKVFEEDIWCGTHYPPAVAEVRSFDQDKQVNTGTLESEAAESVADSGQAWGDATPDAGAFENEPEESPAGYSAPADNQGYTEEAYEETYEEEAYEEGYEEEAYYEEEGY